MRGLTERAFIPLPILPTATPPMRAGKWADRAESALPVDASYRNIHFPLAMGAGVARIPAALISMTKFRPCIDLHQGKVKQIVGGSLRDEGAGPTENFVSDRPAGWFAETFRDDGLTGGHVIKLGPGNDEAAREALAAWPGGLQIGGGIPRGQRGGVAGGRGEPCDRDFGAV